MSRDDLQLLQGTLDLLILRALSNGPQHGYAIAKWIGGATDDALHIEEGSLYPALYRLEERGWLASSWQKSETGRRARVYRLTARGRRALGQETSQWQAFVAAMAKVLS